MRTPYVVMCGDSTTNGATVEDNMLNSYDQLLEKGRSLKYLHSDKIFTESIM